VALVAVDEDESEGPGSPLVPTASWGYARLRRSQYGESAIQEWVSRLRQQPWSDAYVFLKHEDGSPNGPDAAARVQEILTQIS
jgi:hypothetical protein